MKMIKFKNIVFSILFGLSFTIVIMVAMPLGAKAADVRYGYETVNGVKLF